MNEELECIEEYIDYQHSKEEALLNERVVRIKEQEYLKGEGYECRYVPYTYTEQQEYKWLLNQYKYVVVPNNTPDLKSIELRINPDSFTPISLIFHWTNGSDMGEGVIGVGSNSQVAWESCIQTLNFEFV
jgi:hypothetical protein